MISWILVGLLTGIAFAERLPGIPLTFNVGEDGSWTLADNLPPEYVSAGVEPGWILTAIDGRAITDPVTMKRYVAAGPAREVQLLFEIPPPPPQPEDGEEPAEGEDVTAGPLSESVQALAAPAETIVNVMRSTLIRVEEVGLLPWPEGFESSGSGWQETPMGLPALLDRFSQPWYLDTETGAQIAGNFETIGERPVPDVWWTLADGQWILDTGDDIISADAEYVRTRLGSATRIRRFQDQVQDHLLVPDGSGLQVWSVEWPRWTPALPSCVPQIPETCLSSGRQIMADLSGRPGGVTEALRHLGLACEGGVFRACYESIAIISPEKAEPIERCLSGDLNACHDLSKERYKIESAAPTPVMMGMLEFTCQMDASGTLGERLRRLEDVGEGCMMLSGALDALLQPDRALLSLDQACVLGRADACSESAQRRSKAFALRTATECEDEAVPVASACVELGQLLQQGPVEATGLDAFEAFLRGCSLGEEAGCKFLGDYVDRWGIDNERVLSAEQNLQSSCEQGEQRACLGRAYLLVRHEPRSTAYAQALEVFSASCEAGLASACIAGARQRRIGQARRVEAPEQLEMWSSACGRFSAKGCAGYGELLSRNKRTYLDAFMAWTQACDIGDAHSCTELGRLVLERHKEAWPGEQPSADYLSLGCENGDAEGCYWLAADELPKQGEPPEAAYIMLERSCEGGFGDGCADLAAVHLDRRTSFDDEIAAGHLDSACESGHYDSCRVLGQMYLRGKGVDRDRDLAREYTERFRVNASRRHLRFGPSIGFPYVAGGAAEVVLPVPVGPALSFGGTYAYLPVLGTALMFLEGESNPDRAPGYTYWDGVVRLYPNNKARGLYGGAGYHVLTAAGGDLATPLTRSGLSFRIGISNDQKWAFSRVELGLAQYGIIELKDFDDNETGAFPLIQPVLGVSFGFALL